MELISTAIFSLVIPLVLIILLGLVPDQSRIVWLFRLFFTASIVIHSYVVGVWAQLGLFTKYVLLILFLLASLRSFQRINRVAVDAKLMIHHKIVNGVYGFTACLFCLMTGVAISGLSAPNQAVELDFPLSHGAFMVGEGGNATNINHHFKQGSRQYAVDIVKTNQYGFTLSAPKFDDLESYEIFGQNVISPIEGIIVYVQDQQQDQPPFNRNYDFPPGNVLGVKNGEITVFMAHLKQGSIQVKLGDSVTKGQVVARVGNSGDSSTPHLHIHAEKNVPSGELSGGTPWPMSFNGRFLTRNDVVKSEQM